MKRAAIEKGRTHTVWRKHWNKHVQQNVRSGGRSGIECECDQQVNRFRKGQKQAGCNKPKCYICHGEKLLGIPKPRDRKLQIIAREELRRA